MLGRSPLPDLHDLGKDPTTATRVAGLWLSRLSVARGIPSSLGSILTRGLDYFAMWACGAVANRYYDDFELSHDEVAVTLVGTGVSATFVPTLTTVLIAEEGWRTAYQVLALGSFVTIWRLGLGGLGYAVTAIFVGAALLAYPLYLGTKAYTLPPIYDITTDVLDPPAFDAVRRLRSRTTNPAQYAGLYAAEQQRAAYPEVAPLELSVPAKNAYDQALAVVNKRRWLVLVAGDGCPAQCQSVCTYERARG